MSELVVDLVKRSRPLAPETPALPATVTVLGWWMRRYRVWVVAILAAATLLFVGGRWLAASAPGGAAIGRGPIVVLSMAATLVVMFGQIGVVLLGNFAIGGSDRMSRFDPHLARLPVPSASVVAAVTIGQAMVVMGSSLSWSAAHPDAAPKMSTAFWICAGMSQMLLGSLFAWPAWKTSPRMPLAVIQVVVCVAALFGGTGWWLAYVGSLGGGASAWTASAATTLAAAASRLALVPLLDSVRGEVVDRPRASAGEGAAGVSLGSADEAIRWYDRGRERSKWPATALAVGVFGSLLGWFLSLDVALAAKIVGIGAVAVTLPVFWVASGLEEHGWGRRSTMSESFLATPLSAEQIAESRRDVWWRRLVIAGALQSAAMVVLVATTTRRGFAPESLWWDALYGRPPVSAAFDAWRLAWVVWVGSTLATAAAGASTLWLQSSGRQRDGVVAMVVGVTIMGIGFGVPLRVVLGSGSADVLADRTREIVGWLPAAVGVVLAMKIASVSISVRRAGGERRFVMAWAVGSMVVGGLSALVCPLTWLPAWVVAAVVGILWPCATLVDLPRRVQLNLHR